MNTADEKNKQTSNYNFVFQEMFCSIMRRQPVFNHGQNVTVAATSLPLSIAHWFAAQSCRFDGFIDLPVFKADPTQIVSQQNIESLAQKTEHLIECAWQWTTRMSRTADGGAHGSWRSINLNKKTKIPFHSLKLYCSHGSGTVIE